MDRVPLYHYQTMSSSPSKNRNNRRRRNNNPNRNKRGGQGRNRSRHNRDRRDLDDNRPHTWQRPKPKKTFLQKLLALFGIGVQKPTKKSGSAKASKKTAPKTKRPKKKPEQVAVTSGRLYVGNLSFDAAESDLIDLFSGVGNVREAEVIINRHNQRSKGFAFVEMADTEEAKRAVTELHDKDFMGRKLVVSGAKTLET